LRLRLGFLLVAGWSQIWLLVLLWRRYLWRLFSIEALNCRFLEGIWNVCILCFSFWHYVVFCVLWDGHFL
jgi:hypothetical protein